MELNTRFVFIASCEDEVRRVEDAGLLHSAHSIAVNGARRYLVMLEHPVSRGRLEEILGRRLENLYER